MDNVTGKRKTSICRQWYFVFKDNSPMPLHASVYLLEDLDGETRLLITLEEEGKAPDIITLDGVNGSVGMVTTFFFEEYLSDRRAPLRQVLNWLCKQKEWSRVNNVTLTVNIV